MTVVGKVTHSCIKGGGTSLHLGEAPQAYATDPVAISVLGWGDSPAPWLPQPGHLHLAGATLAHSSL